MTKNKSFFIKDCKNQEQALQIRQKMLQKIRQQNFANLFKTKFDVEKVGVKNCENLIGGVEVPVGLAGPVKLNFENKDYEIILPLACTEGALVASVNRGCKAINENRAQAFVKYQGMTRAPVYKLESYQEALEFISFIDKNFLRIKTVVEKTSKHLKLLDIQKYTRGNLVFLRFLFDTDQAMGMNMVTIALAALEEQIIAKETRAYLVALSSNFCTDKKDNGVNRLLGRGYMVHTETLLSHECLEKILKTNAEKLFETHVIKNLVGSNLALSSSQNMQAANVIAALFLATGQDIAHLVEASQCAVYLEKRSTGLYVSLDLPNLNLGVVGGGTYLSAQQQARSLIFKKGNITPFELAAAMSVAVLAVEISGLAALSSQDLARAHARLAR